MGRLCWACLVVLRGPGCNVSGLAPLQEGKFGLRMLSLLWPEETLKQQQCSFKDLSWDATGLVVMVG